MRLGILLILTAISNAFVCAFPEGFFAKLTNFFRRKPTSSPSDEITTTYRHYSSPDEDIFDAHAEKVSQASCQNGEVYVDEAGTCMAVQYPGQPCQYSKQCDAVEDGSFCSRLRCECASGMQISGRSCVYSNQNCHEKGLIWIEEVGECKRAIPPGSTGCSHSSQCASVFKGSSCYRQTCNCPSPLFPVNGTCGPLCLPQQTFSSVTGECLPKISPGGECLYSRQCNAAQLGTACIRGRCRCVDKFVFNGMNCAKSCHKGFVSNKYGICRRECSRNQVEYDSDCYDKVSVGQRCEFHAQCSANSTCLQGVCTCPANTVLKSGSCRPKEVQPMESCADGEQCIGGSYCHNEKCVCPSGTKIISAQCVTPIAVGPGENCLRQNVKCSEGSVCMSGVCSCLTGTILHKGKCERHVSVDPGGSCGRGEHCEGGSFCDHNIWKCVCPLDKIEIGKKCYPRLKSAPGFPCGNKEICIGGSYCLDDICVCAPSQVRQGRQCVTRRRVPAGSRCNSADICMGSSHCLDGFCECDEGKSVKQGECVITKQASPGDGCGQGERCGGGSNCVNKICTCPANYIVYEQQCRLQPISQPGMRCGRGERCVGDSYCDYDRSTCVCRNDFVASAGKCQPPTEVGVQPLSMLLRGSTHSSSSFTTPTFAPHASITRTPSNTQHPIEAAETPTDSPFTIIGHHIISQVSHPAASTQRKTSHQMRSAGHISAENQRRVVNTERLSKQGSQIQSRSDQVIPNGRNSTSDVSNDAYLKSDQANVVDEIVKPADEVTVVNQIQTVKSRQSPTPVGANMRSDVEEGSRSMASAQSAYRVTRCRDDRDCSGGTRCARGYCLCPVYHTLIDGKCHSANSATTISAATLARPRRCVASIQCSNGTECIWGVCRCPRGTTQSQLGVCSPERTDRHSNRMHRFNGVRSHQRHTMTTACPSDGSCQLPDCYCSRTGMEIPGGYNASEIPQMVVLTFEGAVTDRIIQMYKSLFTGRFRNPNGCPIQATFFITHEWNNYDQSQWLMSTGHEIGVSSMTGDVLNQTSKQRWHAEMNGMREALGLFSYVPVNEIIGLRAPRHQLGGDNQFSTMLSSDFKYDSTTSFSGGPYWPQTLDYKLAWECSENGCPQKPYPGLWELPISPLKRPDSGDESTTVKDMVKSGDSPNDIATMLEKNFRRHYYNNRAPFVIAIDSDYLTSLQDNAALKALEIFIEQILQNQDVYVVSASQALQWLQLPTRLQKIPNFKAWQCSNQSTNRVQPCEYPSICTLRCDRDELHSFRVCGSCPLAYPKIGDPRGSGNVIMVN